VLSFDVSTLLITNSSKIVNDVIMNNNNALKNLTNNNGYNVS
jgi:hypothetical protein